jgi:hypothetical protein
MNSTQASDFDRLCRSLSSVPQRYFRIRVLHGTNRQVLIIDSVSEYQYKSAIINFEVSAEPRWARRPPGSYITIGPPGNKRRFVCRKAGGWDVSAIIDEVRTRIEQERRDVTEAERLKALDAQTKELIERLDYPHISPSHLENCILFKFAKNISVSQAERLVEFLRFEGLV